MKLSQSADADAPPVEATPDAAVAGGVTSRGFRGCWFVSTDGVSVEAMTEGQVLIGLKRGHLTPDTLVTLDSHGPWLPIEQVAALANAVLLSSASHAHSSRPPRPVILEALPSPAETRAMEQHVAPAFARRTRQFLSAFFAAGLFAALFLF